MARAANRSPPLGSSARARAQAATGLARGVDGDAARPGVAGPIASHTDARPFGAAFHPPGGGDVRRASAGVPRPDGAGRGRPRSPASHRPRVAVGAVTATREDFAAMVAAKAPLVLALVLLGGFIVLHVTFRSLVVPAKAIVLNLLSVAAAVGVLVSIFQDGYGASLLGTHHVTAIISWVPLFLFVVLFGLSMDYHVFILSRIRELV